MFKNPGLLAGIFIFGKLFYFSIQIPPMKKLFLILVALFFVLEFKAQNKYSFLSYVFPSDSLNGFGELGEKSNALSGGYFGLEYKVYMYRAKRNYINNKYKINRPTEYTNKISYTINSAPCLNEDFEASPVGSVSAVSGWTITEGNNLSTCTMGGCCTVTATGLNSWIRSTPYTAPWPIGTIPNSPLGGNKIIQLNDEIINTGEMVRMEQAFPVTTSNSFFQYAYLCAFDGTGHACCNNPYFNVLFYDCSNNLISSATTSIIAPGLSCSYPVSNWVPPVTSSGIGYQSSWQLKTVDLTPYIGSCVRVQVNVGDCDAWAHPGMCFFDAKCSQLEVNVNGTSVSPSGSATVCAVQATLSAPPGLTPVIWSGPIGSGINTNTNSAVTTSVSGSYTLTTGTGTNVTVNVFSLTVLPSLTIGLSVSSNTTCKSGSPVILTGSPTGGVYTGSFVTGNTFNPPATPGTYTVGYTYTSPTSGCIASSTQTILVKDVPSTGIIFGNSTYCSNDSVLTFSTIYHPDIISYNWTPPPGWIGTTNSNSFLVNPGAQSGTISLSVTNACGSSITNTMAVVPLPSPTLSITGPTSTCIGNTVGLVANGATYYNWNGGVLGNGNNLVVSPTVSATYTLFGIFTNGCQSTLYHSITVNPLPTILANSSTTLSCSDYSVGLFATGGTSYTWSPSNLIGASVVVNPTITTTYSVTGIDLNGCKNTDSIKVNVIPSPVVWFSYTNVSICAGQSVAIGAMGNAISHTWSPSGFIGNVLVINNTIATTTLTVVSTGTNGCTKTSYPVVYVNPAPSITASTSDSILCIGQTATLVANGGSSYTWYPGGITGSTITVQPLSTTLYTVVGVGFNSCQGYTVVNQNVASCTNLSDINNSGTPIIIYPNPNKGEFIVKSEKKELSIELTNDIGQVLQRLHLNASNNFSVEVNNLPSGMYFLTGKQFREKVVITK